MRVIQNAQMQIGEIDVSRIVLDPRSRDDIPQILRGVQHLYADPVTRRQLFQLLEAGIAPAIDKNTGRPGVTLWSIFVCGVIRLDLDIDYDRLHNLVNRHLDIEMRCRMRTSERQKKARHIIYRMQNGDRSPR